MGNLASPNVPEAMLLALRAVRADPSAAGSVAGNLASGTVPDPRFVAFNEVKLAPEAAVKLQEIYRQVKCLNLMLLHLLKMLFLH